MSKRSIFLALALIVMAGIAVYAGFAGRSVPPPAEPVADGSADALSRAMTFTQPSEPAK